MKWFFSTMLFMTSALSIHSNFGMHNPTHDKLIQQVTNKNLPWSSTWSNKFNPLGHRREAISAIDRYTQELEQRNSTTKIELVGGQVAIVPQPAMESIITTDDQFTSLDTTRRRKKEKGSGEIQELLKALEEIRVQQEAQTQILTPYSKIKIVGGGIVTLSAVFAGGFTLVLLALPGNETGGESEYSRLSSNGFNLLSSIGAITTGAWMIYEGWTNSDAQSDLATTEAAQLHLIQKYNALKLKEKSEAKQKRNASKKKNVQSFLDNNNHNDVEE